MRITYIARHGGHDNDDEGAIAYALEQLGHDVRKIPETCSVEEVNECPCDFVLFHKWERYSVMEQVKWPMAFWYFDLLTGDGDPRLKLHERRHWVHVATSRVVAGFCTDGDWVALDRTGKLVCLRQGADERKVGLGVPGATRYPLLFTGIVLGDERREHLARLRTRYPLRIVGAMGYKGRVHGRELADLIASSDIVFSPISPVTDRYWSNRVYLTLGFGGFLVHRYARDLTDDYAGGKEIVYYETVESSFDVIDYYLARPDERAEIAQAGYQRTINDHLYRHRVAKLIRVMEERL